MKTKEFFDLDRDRNYAESVESIYLEQDPEFKEEYKLYAVTADGEEIARYHGKYCDFAEYASELQYFAEYWELRHWVQPDILKITDSASCAAEITLTDLDGEEHTMSIEEVIE